jgi:PTS system beta-glucosides-specific IIC component
MGMSKKYEGLAAELVQLLGGKQNILNAYHCQTRIRFSLADEAKADKEAIEKLDGVAKVLINAGVFQVVIGTHVAEAFEEVEKLIDIGGTQDVKEESQGIFNSIISFVAGTFQPIIPALSGAGMVKAVMALLVVFKIISTDSQTYYMLNVFADSVFYFLPVMIAFSEAKKLKCNPILAASVAAMILHPNWLALVTAGEPVRFFNLIPFHLTGYANSVIPIILIVFVQSYVEKFLNKVVPKAVQLVFVPMLTFLVMGVLSFSVLGPIGSIVGGWLAVFFTFLSTNAAWAPAVLVGGFLPVMVMFGIHNGIAPLGVMQMSNLGFDSIFGPGCVVSNMCQATAGLVVALRTKNRKDKEIAASGSITAYMGITEPILYGINLPKKYPLIAAMIGGGFGGLYAGLTHTHRFATGSSGLPAVLLYIGDNTMKYLVNILIAMGIGVVITAVLTYILSLKYEKNVSEPEQEAVPETVMAPEMKSEVVLAPLAGTVQAISEAKDEVFSSEALGKGAVIFPENGELVSPVNGKIETLFPTLHAIGITSEAGSEILIHIGIDTVKLNGEGFKAYVQAGDTVTAGQMLISFDKDAIEAKGYDVETMIVVTNSPDYAEISLLKDGKTSCCDEILELTVNQ